MSAARVGIVGAGQLGRMMALAGYPLDIECRFIDREAHSPAGQVAPLRIAELDDAQALAALAREVDVLTFDIENVGVDALTELADIVPVYPPPRLVAVAQDRLAEKELFRSFSIPTAPFVAVDGVADLERAGDSLGWPIVLKARRLGYDGRGQRVVAKHGALLAAWDDLGRVPAIAEGWVAFDRELSLIAARGADDAQVYYSLTENAHRDGILIESLAPYENPGLQNVAARWLEELMRAFDYRGVLTVEFFLTANGLVANEIAPRVHNSGHWTIEGAETSLFENHLRAILGWPLGSAEPRGHAAMLNFLGALPDARRVIAFPGAHFHAYGKEPRPARKLGHCTLVDARRDRLLARLQALRGVLGQPGG
jgi:5-(carboxyamino)imidazole ribonucleotide synthase